MIVQDLRGRERVQRGRGRVALRDAAVDGQRERLAGRSVRELDL